MIELNEVNRQIKQCADSDWFYLNIYNIIYGIINNFVSSHKIAIKLADLLASIVTSITLPSRVTVKQMNEAILN